MSVPLSVSLSLNLYNREWTYFNETHHNSLLSGPHDIFKVTVKGQVRQWRPWKSCELDRFGTAEEISINTYTNTSYSQATNWLRLYKAMDSKVKFSDNIFQKVHFYGQGIRFKHRHKEMQIC